MIYSPSVTNEEIAYIINTQIDNGVRQDALSRKGLIGFIESLKENTNKNAPRDSYYIIKKRLEKLQSFKESQEKTLFQFKQILIKF